MAKSWYGPPKLWTQVPGAVFNQDFTLRVRVSCLGLRGRPIMIPAVAQHEIFPIYTPNPKLYSPPKVDKNMASGIFILRSPYTPYFSYLRGVIYSKPKPFISKPEPYTYTLRSILTPASSLRWTRNLRV